MSQLGEILESLTLDGGLPDHNARKAELSGLIRYLTETEVQDFRLQLNARRIPNDLCRRFPVEIVQEIVKYLNLEELIRARHVSKSWLEVIGGDETLIKMLQWHFPMIWKRDYQHLSQAEQVSNIMSPQKVLLAQAEKLGRRKRGLYLSMATYQLPTKVDSFQYCNGRIAFQKRYGDSIHVWSLRSNVRSVYADENREFYHLWELSDSLLVCQKRSPSRLVVWDLNSPESAEPMNIHLPSSIHGFWAHQDQVAIILSTFETMIWKWGGPLQKIDTSGLTSTFDSSFALDDLDIFFHPYDTGKIFIVADVIRDPESKKRLVYISECALVNNEWKSKFACSVNSLPACVHKTHKAELVRSHQTDIGIFVVVKVPSDDRQHHACFNHRAGQMHIDEWASNEFLCEYTTFDMLTGELEEYTYSLPKRSKHHFRIIRYIEDVLLLSRDQLLLPVRKADIGGDENTGAGLVSLRGFPKGVAQSSELGTRPSGPKSENGSELINDWAGGILAFSPDPFEADAEYSHAMSVKGDEDFVVLFGDGDFVVWCFDDTVILPQYSTSG